MNVYQSLSDQWQTNVSRSLDTYHSMHHSFNSCGIQQNIFGGHCPLWTELTLIYGTEEEVAQELTDLFEENKIRSKGWAEYVIVNYECERDCQVYLTVCFLSCIFGAVWLMMYFMCGKGGYDRGMQVILTQGLISIINEMLMLS